MNAFSESSSINHNYKLRIETRKIFMIKQLREEIGELFDLLVHSYFVDNGTMSVWVESDSQRWLAAVISGTVPYSESGVTTELRKNFRQSIDIVAREGLIGTFFKIIIEKVIPDDGNWKYFGLDLNIIPRPEYGPEFIDTLGANTENWT